MNKQIRQAKAKYQFSQVTRHTKSIEVAGDVYGCHNHAPFKPLVEWKGGRAEPFEFRMSMDCKYDNPHIDNKCNKCTHAKVNNG